MQHDVTANMHFATLLALATMVNAMQVGPCLRHPRLPERSLIAAQAAPAELSAADWRAVPIAAAATDSAESLMQEVLEWLPNMLQNLNVDCALTDDASDVAAYAAEELAAKVEAKMAADLSGKEEEEDEADVLDDDFVNVGRPWLHTAAFELATGAQAGDLGSAVWSQATDAAFLREGGGGGGLLILVPQLAGDLELFEKLGAAIAAAARREINAALMVQACHPQAGVAARRCPIPLFQLFADSPDLYVDGA